MRESGRESEREGYIERERERERGLPQTVPSFQSNLRKGKQGDNHHPLLRGQVSRGL